MGRPKKLENLTPEERLERDRLLNRERQKRFQQKLKDQEAKAVEEDERRDNIIKALEAQARWEARNQYKRVDDNVDRETIGQPPQNNKDYYVFLSKAKDGAYFVSTRAVTNSTRTDLLRLQKRERFASSPEASAVYHELLTNIRSPIWKTPKMYLEEVTEAVNSKTPIKNFRFGHFLAIGYYHMTFRNKDFDQTSISKIENSMTSHVADSFNLSDESESRKVIDAYLYELVVSRGNLNRSYFFALTRALREALDKSILYKENIPKYDGTVIQSLKADFDDFFKDRVKEKKLLPNDSWESLSKEQLDVLFKECARTPALTASVFLALALGVRPEDWEPFIEDPASRICTKSFVLNMNGRIPDKKPFSPKSLRKAGDPKRLKNPKLSFLSFYIINREYENLISFTPYLGKKDHGFRAKNELKEVVFRNFRATTATLLAFCSKAKRPSSFQDVQIRLGHVDTKMAQSVYARMPFEETMTPEAHLKMRADGVKVNGHDLSFEQSLFDLYLLTEFIKAKKQLLSADEFEKFKASLVDDHRRYVKSFPDRNLNVGGYVEF